MGKQVFSYPKESMVPSYVKTAWEDKRHHSKYLTFLLHMMWEAGKALTL